MFYNEFLNSKLSFILLFIYLIFLLNKENIFFKKIRPKISIFVPIYNREKYIYKCIESIQNQTLKDIEIIAINDGSEDNTSNILNNLANKDCRIKIVNNDKNHGLLFSRAMGILNAKGEYIMDLDSDDEINDNESLEYLYNQTKILKVDIIAFNILFKRINSTIKCNNINQTILQPELFNSIFMENNEISDFWICNKLIKREIFLKAYKNFQNWIYKVKWNYFEDDIWNILISRYAKSKICLDRLVYIYNYNNDSLMNKKIGVLDLKNLLYRHEMYKQIFKKKKDEKYLISEYYFLFNRLKTELNQILLINDYNIMKQIKNIFTFFIHNYKCTNEQMEEINNFLKLINVD